MPEYTVEELAGFCGGRPEGERERRITGVSAPESATERDLVFADSERALAAALGSAAGCLVAPENAAAPGRTLIRAANPKLAFAQLARRLHPRPAPLPGVHPQACVEPGVQLGPGVHVGAFAFIGARSAVGARTVISAGCVIGEGVGIGEDCYLHPRVTLYPGVTLGARVVLHSGVVIGADGFGYVFDGVRYEKFLQLGTVEIGDDVEIGANSTVDRAALGRTRIGAGAKIDNLVQVGHNVSIGEHCVIAAQVGISGSCVIEHHAVFAGQVGLGDHARIEAGAVLGGQCGVLPHKTVRKGETVWGTPARPIKEHLRQLAVLARLARKGQA